MLDRVNAEAQMTLEVVGRNPRLPIGCDERQYDATVGVGDPLLTMQAQLTNRPRDRLFVKARVSLETERLHSCPSCFPSSSADSAQ